jgi:hypothetical protein
MRSVLPPDAFGRPFDDVLPKGHPYRDIIQGTLAERQSRGPISVKIPSHGPAGPDAETGTEPGEERLVMAHAIRDSNQQLLGVMLVSRDLEYMGRVQSMLSYSRKLVALGRLSAGVAHEVKPANDDDHPELLKQKPTMPPVRARRGAGRRDRQTARFRPPRRPPARRRAGAGLEHVKIIGGDPPRSGRPGFLGHPVRGPGAAGTRLAAWWRGARVVEPECGKAGVAVKGGSRPVARISGDPTMLRQAFLNLGLNAPGYAQRRTLHIGGARERPPRDALRGRRDAPENLGHLRPLLHDERGMASACRWSTESQMHDGDIEVQSTQAGEHVPPAAPAGVGCKPGPVQTAGSCPSRFRSRPARHATTKSRSLFLIMSHASVLAVMGGVGRPWRLR